MAYPLILAPNGQEIMRINHDASLSVRWDDILHHRYEAMSELNVGIIKVCEVVLAARDNFLETSWDVSTDWADRWDHYMAHLDYQDRVTPKQMPHFGVQAIDAPDLLIARVNFNGMWSVIWDEVDATAQCPTDRWAAVALIGFCRLLCAARDRFRTEPWAEWPEDDDE